MFFRRRVRFSYILSVFDLCYFPATSTDLEAGFSRGGLMVTKLRHCFQDQSVRAGKVFILRMIMFLSLTLLSGTLLGAWARSGLPGIVVTEDLVKNVQSKALRPNNTRGGRGLERTAEVCDITQL